MDKIEPKKESLVAKYLKELFKKTGGEGTYIYRGQGCAAWELLSSAQRRLNNQEKIDKDKKKFKSQDFILYHKHLIENARDLGYDRSNEKDNSLADLEMLAEIQHHGGATCLTDFTTNFLVALWFASKQETVITFKDEFGKRRSNLDGKIFALNIDDDDNFEKIYPIREIREDDSITRLLEKQVQYNDAKKNIEPRFWLWKPARLNNRIVQQDSIFMFGLPRFRDNLKYVSIYIHDKDKVGLRKELETYFNMSAESVFDDLPGFSFEANNADKPIGNKIIENKTCFAKAKDLYRRGEHESAIKYFNRNLLCAGNEGEQCARGCKKQRSELLFERGKCLQQINKKSLQALNDFERVIEGSENEKIILGASRLKLSILYDIRNFKDALSFCLDLIYKMKIAIENKKEFYVSALELSIITGDQEQFRKISNLIKDNKNFDGYGRLLLFYFESIMEKKQFRQFKKEIGEIKVESLDNEIFWDFSDIEKYIKKLNDSNFILMTQTVKEIQTKLRNYEIEKKC